MRCCPVCFVYEFCCPCDTQQSEADAQHAMELLSQHATQQHAAYAQRCCQAQEKLRHIDLSATLHAEPAPRDPMILDESAADAY